MLAQGLGLEISFLWFQCIKPNEPELQKSNASLPLRVPGSLQRAMSLHARPDREVSQPHFGSAPRSHRSADRIDCTRGNGLRRITARRIVERGPRTRCASAPDPVAKTGNAERPAFRARDRRACAGRCGRTATHSRRQLTVRAVRPSASSRSQGRAHDSGLGAELRSAVSGRGRSASLSRHLSDCRSRKSPALIRRYAALAHGHSYLSEVFGIGCSGRNDARDDGKEEEIEDARHCVASGENPEACWSLRLGSRTISQRAQYIDGQLPLFLHWRGRTLGFGLRARGSVARAPRRAQSALRRRFLSTIDASPTDLKILRRDAFANLIKSLLLPTCTGRSCNELHSA